MQSLRVVQTTALALLLMLVSSACGRPVSPKAERNEPEKPVVVLTGELLDALDLFIVVQSMQAAFNPISLSPELRTRLGKYDDKVTYKTTIKNVLQPFVGNGSKTIISEGAAFKATFEGAFNVDVRIISGEVGVIGGQIFVREGTRATVNDRDFKYANGQWVEIEKSMPARTGGAVN